MTNTIKIKCNAENTLELAELTEFQGGLKQRTDIDYDKIKLSICKYGFSFPFFVWKNGSKNYLLDGHGRFATLCKMQKDGYTIPPLPVVYVSCKDKKEAKEKLLRLNSQYGKMTKESVLEFCSDIELNFDEIALPDTVIDFTDATEPQETEGDDEAPEVDEKSEPVSKRGEMYELGNSILMCGDSTNAEDVARLMGGEKADMVFTDPPYNVNYSGRGEKNKLGHIKNDNMSENGFDLFCHDFFENYSNFMKPLSAIYVCHPDSASAPKIAFEKNFAEFFKKASTIIWVKQSAGMGWQDYRAQHEPMLYGWKEGGGKHQFYGDRTETTVWNIKRDNAQNYVHPTQKPVALPVRAIQNSSKEQDIVLDLFGGSGSTLIACEKNNRKARLMELDPKYCDVIRRRYTKWAKENGKPITSGCLE
jgi:DNA modification methylase